MKITYILSGGVFVILACFQIYWKDFEKMGYYVCIAILCLALIEAINKSKQFMFQIKTLKFEIEKSKDKIETSNGRYNI